MFIQLNNHKAHIYNKNPIDSSKKSIIFLPGAGMDHRTLSMFKLSKIESDIKKQIKDVEKFSLESPLPELEELFTEVYL